MGISKPRAIKELERMRKDLLCRAAKAEAVRDQRRDAIGRAAAEEAVGLRRQHSAITQALQALKRDRRAAQAKETP